MANVKLEWCVDEHCGSIELWTKERENTDPFFFDNIVYSINHALQTELFMVISSSYLNERQYIKCSNFSDILQGPNNKATQFILLSYYHQIFRPALDSCKLNRDLYNLKMVFHKNDNFKKLPKEIKDIVEGYLFESYGLNKDQFDKVNKYSSRFFTHTNPEQRATANALSHKQRFQFLKEVFGDTADNFVIDNLTK